MKGTTVVGIAWYRPEQWDRLRQISTDADQLESTHSEWEKNATKTLKRLRRDGIVAQKIDIDVEELVAWCGARGFEVNGKARSEYASFKLREDHRA
jgi:hypothetical protein